MNLKYISLFIKFESGYKDPFRDDFNLNSRFICNFLSIQIRKLKFKTDGTFNMISVVPSKNIQYKCRIVGDATLSVCLDFDYKSYKKMEEKQKYEYYLALLEKGYKISCEYKSIPIDYLLQLHEMFRNNGYKNEWLHNKKKFKEENLEILLKCYFTSFDFQLVITINDIKTKEKLISGTIIRTPPNEIYFHREFKDILIIDHSIIITDFLDRPRIQLNIKDVYKKYFSFQIIGEKKYISYDGSGFSTYRSDNTHDSLLS